MFVIRRKLLKLTWKLSKPENVSKKKTKTKINYLVHIFHSVFGRFRAIHHWELSAQGNLKKLHQTATHLVWMRNEKRRQGRRHILWKCVVVLIMTICQPPKICSLGPPQTRHTVVDNYWGSSRGSPCSLVHYLVLEHKELSIVKKVSQ